MAVALLKDEDFHIVVIPDGHRFFAIVCTFDGEDTTYEGALSRALTVAEDSYLSGTIQ